MKSQVDIQEAGSKESTDVNPEVPNVQIISADSESEGDPAARPQRKRVRPVWMKDYQVQTESDGESETVKQTTN